MLSQLQSGTNDDLEMPSDNLPMHDLGCMPHTLSSVCGVSPHHHLYTAAAPSALAAINDSCRHAGGDAHGDRAVHTLEEAVH